MGDNKFNELSSYDVRKFAVNMKTLSTARSNSQHLSAYDTNKLDQHKELTSVQVKSNKSTPPRQKCVAHEAEGGTGPFKNTLRALLLGSPIPLVFGAFGKINTDTDKFLKVAALTAASTEAGLTMSPLKYMHDSQEHTLNPPPALSKGNSPSSKAPFTWTHLEGNRIVM
eukprot:10695-Ditylum_brightwellii.AAC.1